MGSGVGKSGESSFFIVKISILEWGKVGSGVGKSGEWSGLFYKKPTTSEQFLATSEQIDGLFKKNRRHRTVSGEKWGVEWGKVGNRRFSL